jgi:hypothetical protein
VQARNTPRPIAKIQANEETEEASVLGPPIVLHPLVAAVSREGVAGLVASGEASAVLRACSRSFASSSGVRLGSVRAWSSAKSDVPSPSESTDAALAFDNAACKVASFAIGVTWLRSDWRNLLFADAREGSPE